MRTKKGKVTFVDCAGASTYRDTLKLIEKALNRKHPLLKKGAIPFSRYIPMKVIIFKKDKTDKKAQ